MADYEYDVNGEAWSVVETDCRCGASGTWDHTSECVSEARNSG